MVTRSFVPGERDRYVTDFNLMAPSTDINLPIKHAAEFPNLCVECGHAEPDSTVKVGTNAIGWWTWLLWAFGPRFSVSVPACSRCVKKIQFRRWGSHILCLITALVLVVFLNPLVKPLVPDWARYWTLMICLLLALLPYFIWDIYFPPAIEITAYSDSVDYEFRDAYYAFMFASKNKIEEDTDAFSESATVT